MANAKTGFDRLWEQAQANGRKLDACAGPHEFVDLTPERKLGKSYRCAKCGGEADGSAVHWYRRGLRHAGAGKDGG